MDNKDRRIWIRLEAPGFFAHWRDTPERCQKLLEFAGNCIVESQYYEKDAGPVVPDPGTSSVVEAANRANFLAALSK
jgi:hypothetical protein